MKKPLIIVIVLVILGAIVWYFGGKPSDSTTPNKTENQETISAPVSESTTISDKVSQYRNEELGFAVNHPSAWEKVNTVTGVVFTIPPGNAGTHTIGKLEVKIGVTSGKCAFPPVTTIKERNTLKSGDLTFNMISMSNSVQGRNYFDRMYSLQKDNICYVFAFSSIILNPTSKGYKGSEATQMSNNNKTVVEAADAAFINVVKSFAFVTGPAGQDEAEVNPAKR